MIDQDTTTARVDFSDLNLSSKAAIGVLNARVRRAASMLCGNTGRTDLDRGLAEKRCFDAAVADAYQQVARAARNAEEAHTRMSATLIAGR